MTPYDIRPMPAQIAQDTLATLAKIEPATFGHYRHIGFVNRAIAPVIKRRVVGTAVTIDMPPLEVASPLLPKLPALWVWPQFLVCHLPDL